jgi:hypothetical protein
MAIDDGGSAFPVPISVGPSDVVEFSDQYQRGGMSLRAYIATAVLAGHTSLRGLGVDHDSVFAARADEAVKQADALIAALKE